MKRILALLICLLFVFSTNVFASRELTISAVFSSQTEDITISGSGPVGDIIVTVEAHDNTEEFSDTNPPFDIFSVKNSGEFSYTVELSGIASGKKLVVKATSADGQVASDAFINPDFSGALSVIDNVNSAESLSEFTSTVNSNSTLFGFDTESEIFASSKDEIYAILYAIKPSNASPAQIYELFYTSCALAGFKNASCDEVEKLLSDNSDYFKIDFDKDYTNDSRLTSESKKALCNLISSEKFSEVLSHEETFSKYLEKAKALSNIKTAKNWQDIKLVMEDDFAKLFNLTTMSASKAQNVYGKMMNYAYSAFNDISNNYAKAIEEVEKQSQKPTSGGSSGLGGGGSSVKLPSSVDIDTNINSESVSQETKSPMVVLPEDCASNFSDVPDTHWSYTAVSALTEAGIINGYDSFNFKPENNITRAEFTKLVCKSFGIPSANAEFSDVADDAWYNGCVGGAGKYGIVNGYGELFNPDGYITRQDAAVIAYRALKNEDIILNGSADFADFTDISLYALTAVGAFKEYGILQGDGTNFYPQNNITRAEAAQLLYNVLNTGAGQRR